MTAGALPHTTLPSDEGEPLCAVCYNLDVDRKLNDSSKDNSTIVTLKTTLDAVERSSQAGCQFCHLVLEASSLLEPVNPPPSLLVILLKDRPHLVRFDGLANTSDLAELYAPIGELGVFFSNADSVFMAQCTLKADTWRPCREFQ